MKLKFVRYGELIKLYNRIEMSLFDVKVSNSISLMMMFAGRNMT